MDLGSISSLVLIRIYKSFNNPSFFSGLEGLQSLSPTLIELLSKSFEYLERRSSNLLILFVVSDEIEFVHSW